MVKQSAFARGGKGGDIAAIAVFLATYDAGWLTGEQLIASGGIRASSPNWN